MTIDYRDLLKRYMRHVEEEEGTIFLPRSGLRVGRASFTQAECDELSRLDDEVEAERPGRSGAPGFVTWTGRRPRAPTPIHPDEIAENVDPLAGLPGGTV